MKCVLLLHVLVISLIFADDALSLGTDTYDEELTIKRLNTGQLLSKFRFVITTTNSSGPNYILFPRIIAEISNKYGVNEFHFSLSQGFWRNAEWGIPPQPSSPSGAQLTAKFYGNESSVDDRWNHFVNSLNGIFCTSLLEMVPALTASPLYTTYSSSKIKTSTRLFTRQGALAGETVCTENLTPWRKLLPCKETGLCVLLNPEKLYSSVYHSMGVHMTPVCPNGLELCSNRTRLELDLDMVTDLDLQGHSLDWSFFSLFGRKVESKCKVADTTRVIFEKDYSSASIIAPKQKRKHRGRGYYIYEINQLTNDSFPFNLHSRYRTKLDMLKAHQPSAISIHSFLGGTDQQSGKIITIIKNHQRNQQAVLYTQIIPWFVQVYFHTIRFTCSSQRTNRKVPNSDTYMEPLHFVQARNRKRPFLLEYNLTLPAESICNFHFDFDKAFLRVTDFPPDANHGMYIPAAKISFFAKEELLGNNETVPGNERHTVFEELNNRKSLREVSIYGEVLLVSLPVPDFSMPFNVICFVSTAIAMLFGPVHSLTTKILIPISNEDKDLVPKPLLTALLIKIFNLLRTLVLKVKGNFKKNRTDKQEDMDEDLDTFNSTEASDDLDQKIDSATTVEERKKDL